MLKCIGIPRPDDLFYESLQIERVKENSIFFLCTDLQSIAHQFLCQLFNGYLNSVEDLLAGRGHTWTPLSNTLLLDPSDQGRSSSLFTLKNMCTLFQSMISEKVKLAFKM